MENQILTIDEAMKLAGEYLYNGRLDEAEILLRQIVTTAADFHPAYNLLGVIAFNKGELPLSAGLIAKASALAPEEGIYHRHLSELYRRLGRLDDAVAEGKRAAELRQDDPDAYYNLGFALAGKCDWNAAILSYRQALELNPQHDLLWNNLGMALEKLGDLPSAEAAYTKAIELNPANSDAQFNLETIYGAPGLQRELPETKPEFLPDVSPVGEPAPLDMNTVVTLFAEGRYAEATSLAQTLTVRFPLHGFGWKALGVTLKKMGRNMDALASMRQATALLPNDAQAHNNLGNLLQELGRLDESLTSCHRALEINPDFAEAHINLGNTLFELLQFNEAEACYRRALKIKYDYSAAHSNLGNALRELGRINEAISSYRQALIYDPSNAMAHSNLLGALNFHPDLSREEVFQASREYDALIGLPLRSGWPAFSNDRNPHRRLRVAYFSLDFRRHPVALFAEPIFANHDKSQVEIFCYAEVVREDEVTARFRQYAGHWHSTVGLSDEAMAEMIRNHRIDILVDLAGHTSGNRLPVFARKPAPIQITYLGYPGTTGLSAMDYRITDHYADPDGIADAFYSEQLLRLPNSLWCYRPGADMPEVSPLPALARGHLTFGSFNNFNKIEQPTLELWAELLRALPTSRLMMLTVPEGEPRLRLANRFAQLGIAAQRLEFHGKLPPAEFHRKFLEVDITLDPVNVNGATTTCESLWMGVPVLSLAGERFLTRAGLSILSTAGFADFAATSREDYIRIARLFADDLSQLAEIRAGLRDRIRTSPLIDEVGFTRNLEKLYRDIWRKWCNKTSESTIQAE